MKSKGAIRYLYGANPLYVHFKKHFCPKCNTRVGIRYVSRIVNSQSIEAKDYDFSVDDTYLVGDVEFRTMYFYCEKCQLDIPFSEMKKFEKEKRR